MGRGVRNWPGKRGIRSLFKECSVAAKEDKEDSRGEPRVILCCQTPIPSRRWVAGPPRRGKKKKKANQKRRHRKMKGI